MFWFGFGMMAHGARRALTPRRRYYRSSCPNRDTAPPTKGEVIGGFVGLAILVIILVSAGVGQNTGPPPPPAPGSYINNTDNPGGWYRGYDGNYYPDGFPTARTMPKPPPAAATATPPADTSTNWVLICSVFGMVFGGFVILFMLGLMMKPKPLPGASSNPPSTRRRPSGPPPKWRPYDEPFDL